MNISLNGTNCFIAYMRYHGIFSYSEVKMTDNNFSSVIETANIDIYRNLFTNVERLKVSKTHTMVKNKYKVYLNRVNLVKIVNIIRTKKGKPDMRFHSNVLAAKQIKINAFFGTTI